MSDDPTDKIDGMTLDEFWALILAAKPVFWTCPRGCRGTVEWERPEMIPECKVCGTKGEPQRTTK